MPNDDEVSVARTKLLSAIKSQPMDPMQLGFAAYVNGVLLSARVDALTDLYINPPNQSWTKAEALEHAFANAMDKITEAFEAQARKIQVASPIHLNGSN